MSGDACDGGGDDGDAGYRRLRSPSQLGCDSGPPGFGIPGAGCLPSIHGQMLDAGDDRPAHCRAAGPEVLGAPGPG